MSLHRKWFYDHVAQTSEFALGLEVDRAEGIHIYNTSGKKFYDLNSGISVSSLGHRHPHVIYRIKNQLDLYLHTMVYGEHIQAPQAEYAKLLISLLNNHLDNIYFVNSGSEAVEASIKLARKYTGRFEVLSAAQAYHGSTIAAESLRSDIEYTKHFVPTIPGVDHIRFNNEGDLNKINTNVACVIIEPIQAEAGIILPENDYLQKLEKRCRESGTLLVLDEIQTGFGRVGTFFAFQKFNILPDILLLAKGMGGGMPIGALVSNKTVMKSFASSPALGHITTFGGHPVCVAAALGTLEVLKEESVICLVEKKGKLICETLQHPAIKSIRYAGLFIAVELVSHELLTPCITALYNKGILVDYFLFNNTSFRIAPPLIISEDEIREVCKLILEVLDEL
jgi:putrescine aminotransferase